VSKKFFYITAVLLALIVFSFANPAFSQNESGPEEEEELLQSRPNPLDDDATKGTRMLRENPGEKRSNSLKSRSQQQMKRQSSPAAGKSSVEMPPDPLGKEQAGTQSGHKEQSLNPAMQGESQSSGNMQQKMPGGTGR
jgi:hypothetical protein